MNEIEKRFYDAFWKYYELPKSDIDEMEFMYGITKVEYQYPIELNIVDFYIEKDLPNGNCSKFVVEIDGHEYHKTKEQRYHDYVRERKLQKKGYYIIRFTASEVFVDADKCVKELDVIMTEYYMQGFSLLEKEG
jgi:very-short-patch-repair endonuclease